MLFPRFLPWITLIAAGAMISLLLLETKTHVLATVGYIAITGSALWLSAGKRQLFLITIYASIALIGGYVLAISIWHPTEQATFLLNRISALGVVWFALYFTLRHRVSQARELRQRQQLEEIKLEEERLKSSLSIYQAIADNFPAGWIGLLDESLTYVVADGKGMARMGLTRSDIAGKDFNSVFQTNADRTLLEKVQGGKSVDFQVEFNQRMLEVVASPLLGIHKNQWILVVVHDITALKETETELVNALEKERKLGEMKSQFVTMASHEFRTPLSTILSSSSLLSGYTGEKLEQEKGKHIARIKNSVKHINDILGEFLFLQRLEEEGVQISREELSVGFLMEEILAEIDTMRQGAQTFSAKRSGKDAIFSDRLVLKKILLNLLSNAFKFSQPAGLINLEVVVRDRLAQFHVSDTGMGILPEDREHIFKKFFRGTNAINIQGTGLGLTIVQQYLLAMPECDIAFSSEPGRSTVFTFSIKV